MISSKTCFCVTLFLLLSAKYIYSQPVVSDFLISEIEISGNNRTKEKVLFRELTIHIGDSIKIHDLEKVFKTCKLNLLNTGLFNYVSISFEKIDDIRIRIDILVEERWYVWPYPILEHADRNFSNYLNDREWSRVNYGGFLAVYNFRGKDETLKLKARVGYKEQFAFGYMNPGLDKRKNHGLDLTISKFRQKQIAYNTVDNKLVYVKSEKEYLKEFFIFDVKYIFRIDHNIYHNFGASYYSGQLNNDTVVYLNENYFGQKSEILKYTSFSYEFVYDNRDLKYYPLNGIYTSLMMRKSGSSSNSEVDFFRLDVNCNIYKQITNRFFYAIKSKGSALTGENNAYVTTNTLGYEDYLRGYEYFVIDGTNYFLISNTIKWNVLKETIKNLTFLPLSKFSKVHYSVYLSGFFDTGYVNDLSNISVNNFMSDQFLYSYGIGFDLVTYYDKMLRLEYSINKFDKKGIYVHFQKYF